MNFQETLTNLGDFFTSLFNFVVACVQDPSRIAEYFSINGTIPVWQGIAMYVGLCAGYWGLIQAIKAGRNHRMVFAFFAKTKLKALPYCLPAAFGSILYYEYLMKPVGTMALHIGYLIPALFGVVGTLAVLFYPNEKKQDEFVPDTHTQNGGRVPETREEMDLLAKAKPVDKKTREQEPISAY